MVRTFAHLLQEVRVERAPKSAEKKSYSMPHTHKPHGVSKLAACAIASNPAPEFKLVVTPR